MKKVWLVILAIAVLLSVCACGSEPAGAQEDSSAVPASAQEVLEPSAAEESFDEAESSDDAESSDEAETMPSEDAQAAESAPAPEATPEPAPTPESTPASVSTPVPASAPAPAPTPSSTGPSAYPIGDTGETIPNPNGIKPYDGQVTEYKGMEYLFYDLDECWVENVGGAAPRYF